MTKKQYRTELKKIQRYVKMSQILVQLNIPKNHYSDFMNGNDSCMSIERLETIMNKAKEIMSKLSK